MSSDTAAPWRLTVSALVEAFRTGAVTPGAATQACLDRLEAVNPELNAIVTVDRDGALLAARTAGERWKRGAPRGPLDGVPITVKDNLFVADQRATWGSLLFADHIASADDLPVARLRAAGAVILGKTNTPELALAGYTDNRLFGATGNPWDAKLSPGGSSGGAAAAVMSGIAPLALTTDAGGSTRRPASHVGCVGLKPSLGRVPRRYGFPALASDFQSIGAMARTARDTRLLFDCIAMPCVPSLSPPARLRIGAFCRIGDAPVEPEVERAWRTARAALEALGHSVAEVTAPYDPDEFGEVFMGLASVGVARALRRFSDWEDKVTPPIAELARKGAKITATSYVELIDRVAVFRAHMDDQFAKVDFFLTPTAAGLLWSKNESAPKLIGGREAGPRASAIYTTFVNLAGLAAISIPAGLSAAGHPIGVQIIGPPGSEECILDLAERFEDAQPWPLLAPYGA